MTILINIYVSLHCQDSGLDKTFINSRAQYITYRKVDVGGIKIQQLVSILKDIVGPENVTTSLPDRKVYEETRIEVIRGIPDVVVMPRTTEQVSKILSVANQRGVPVVPRGGGTSQFGGAVAQYGGIMLDLALMNRILEIDEEEMIAVAEGGCSVYMIMHELDKRGLSFPIGPVFTCGPQLGACVAVNATGDFMCRNGRLGDNLAGLELVLPTGEVVTLGTGAYRFGYGHYHRYTGAPDLVGLFVNSAGTLGVITKVAVHIRKRPNAIGYMTYGWQREKANDLAKCMYELQRDGIYDIFLKDMWGKIGAGGGWRPEKEIIPKEIHFVAMMVMDALNEKTLKLKEEHFRQICEKYGGLDLGGEITKRYLGPPEYREFTIPVGRKEVEAAGITIHGKSYVTYFYCPVMKFPEIYDLWESTCKKYGYWNEINLPVWLSWADKNAMNPYPMISVVPTHDPDELRKCNEFWYEFNIELTKRGCPQYAIGPTLPREVMEELGPAYELVKKIKRTLDPKNIMNPGVLF